MNYSQDKIAQMLIKSTENLIKILIKTQTWAVENNVTESDILAAKLAPDMFPLVKQVQIMSDSLKAFFGNLSMSEIPVMEDNEVSLSELIKRLEKTLDYAKSITDLGKSESEKIILPFMPTKFLETPDYIFGFVVPNFYFHLTACYCIIRHLGVAIGKMDYIGSINLQDLN
jgi:hypothetical protein